MAPRTHIGLSFLLSQLGSYTAQRFAERLAKLGLGPRHAGILRFVLSNPDDPPTQRALCERLDIPASRLVPLLDELERRGLLERRTNPDDRRSNLLHPTEAAVAVFAQIEEETLGLEDEVFGTLSASERRRLERSLGGLADACGLVPGIHPAYKE